MSHLCTVEKREGDGKALESTESLLTSNSPEKPMQPPSKARFTADVLKLTSGTVLAQVISLLAAPLIARLFTPEAFGVAALFTSISGILAIVVCLRYDRSIIVPADDRDAINLVAVSLFFVLLVSGVCVPLVFFGKTELIHRLNAPGLEPYFWLVPVNVLFLGILAALNSWSTRKRHFNLIAIAGLLSSVCYVCLALGAGTTGHSGGGFLIIGALAGTVISAIALVFENWRECWPGLVKSVNRQRMLEVLHRYQRFPKYSTGAAILNTVSWELPTFFLSAFFSAGVVGQYALGNRLIRIPMSFIGLNISRVFSQRAAQARHEGTLAPLVENTFQSLVSVGLFPFLLLIFIGKDLFGVVFGARWEEAGVYTAILSLWAFFWFISAPLSSVLDVLDEQAFELRANVLILVTRFVSLLVGGYLRSPRTTLVLFSGSGVLVYGYFCLAILKKCGLPLAKPLRVLWWYSASFVPCGLLILAARFFRLPAIAILAFSFILLVIYYVSTVRTDPDVRAMVFGIMRKQRRQQLTPDVVNPEVESVR